MALRLLILNPLVKKTGDPIWNWINLVYRYQNLGKPGIKYDFKKDKYINLSFFYDIITIRTLK